MKKITSVAIAVVFVSGANLLCQQPHPRPMPKAGRANKTLDCTKVDQRWAAKNSADITTQKVVERIVTGVGRSLSKKIDGVNKIMTEKCTALGATAQANLQQAKAVSESVRNAFGTPGATAKDFTPNQAMIDTINSMVSGVPAPVAATQETAAEEEEFLDDFF